MTTKPQRWYEIDVETAVVYNDPDPGKATSASIVPLADLDYYRRTFDLRKVWAN